METVKGLRCYRCGRTWRRGDAPNLCPQCHRDASHPGILEPIVDPKRLGVLGDLVPRWPRPAGIGYFFPLLPGASPPPSLGEGSTPLLRARNLERHLGIPGQVYLKNETLNPTGSFKDRMAAVLVGMAIEEGARRMILVSSGNMAASVAAYAALSGLDLVTIVPPGSGGARLHQIRAHGAQVVAVRGSGEDRLALCLQAAQALSWYQATSPLNPYGPEGAKTAAYEEFIQLGGAPHYLFLPVGFGCNLVGHFRGYRELQQVGLTERLPRIVAVQPEGSPSLVRAFEEGLEEGLPGPQDTIAGGISQTVTLASRPGLSALRETGGRALAVSDPELLAASRLLAEREGIWAEPSAAAGVAGLLRLSRDEDILPEEKLVVVITGHGLKDPAPVPGKEKVHLPEVDPDLDSFMKILET